MKPFKKEFKTQHLLVLCAMSIIGAFVRNAAMKYGIDGFSCNLVFGITTTILMVIYVHVSDGINRWLVPLLDKHIFYKLADNTGDYYIPPTNIEEPTDEVDGEDISLEDVTFVYAEDTCLAYSDYEVLRQEALEKKAKKEKNLLDAAIHYTRKTFAAYMKEEHLNQLCEYITLFHGSSESPKNLHVIKVDKTIRTIDLLHYAWNVGNLFKKKGIYTATFIKRAFAEALDDVEITTIIRKLRMEGNCIIELKPNLVA